VTTFALHWRRDTDRPDPEAGDRLALGLTRLRDDPVARWTRGPLTVWHFADDPRFSLVEHEAGFVAILIGRLDGFPALSARLGGPAVLGDNPSDATVLAAAYEQSGRGCLAQLLGDFVAIIWDPRERTLLCARDRVGIAPLYFWRDEREVVLAGHLGGVMAHRPIHRVPNEGYVAEVLSDDIHSREETLYRDVWRVVVGHARTFHSSGEAHWEWAPSYSLEITPYRSADEADEHYRDVLTEAITDRMRGPVKVGAELSGGLDSSSVAVLAAAHARDRYGEELRSYSLMFPGIAASDERPYIEEVLRVAGLNATLLDHTPPAATWMTDSARASSDLPLSPNAIVTNDLHLAARRDGVGAVLTGHGGDQWFDISNRYPVDLALRGNLKGAMSVARRMAPGEAALAVFAHGLIRPILAGVARTVRPGFRPPKVVSWISEALARDTSLSDRIMPTAPPIWSSQGERLGCTMAGWEAHVFEVISLRDALTGVTTLHPFCDSRVVQFALSLDESHRWGDGQRRAIQRSAMVGRLPEFVRHRTTKGEFSHLFVEGFQLAGGHDRFANLSIARERDWVRADDVIQRYGRADEALLSGRPTLDLWPLWMILAVDTWYCALVSERASI
jgi:asparagine synthase (glutamine-hydrolysing)